MTIRYFELDGDTVAILLTATATTAGKQEHLTVWPELEATIRKALSGWKHNPALAVDDGMNILATLARRIYPTRFVGSWVEGDDYPSVHFCLSVSVDTHFASASESHLIGQDVA